VDFFWHGFTGLTFDLRLKEYREQPVFVKKKQIASLTFETTGENQ
jgi:hypothetical protein